MFRLRPHGVVVVVLAAVALTVSGCASNPAIGSTAAAPGLSSTVASTPSAATPTLTSELSCAHTFAGQQVLGAMTTTVGALRAYRYGPPGLAPPLASAFAGVPDAQAAAWCVVLVSPTSSSLWGVVAGQQPQRALTENGPGEGAYLGQLTRPPQPP